MLRTILTILQVISALAIVALVLLQRGKGADAGAGFGAGASGTVFGARGSASFLSRTTATLAALFIVTSLSLAYMGGRSPEAPKSVLDRVKLQDAAPELPATTPATPSVEQAPDLPVEQPAPAPQPAPSEPPKQ